MSATWCSNSPAGRTAPIRSRQNVTMKQPAARTHVGTMAGLTLAILLAAPSYGIAQQRVPARFQGVWQNMEGKTGVCKQADWGTAAIASNPAFQALGAITIFAASSNRRPSGQRAAALAG